MNFNTPNFLFLFLPLSLILYFLAAPRWRLWIGLSASLVFYAWGQLFNLPVLLAVIVINFLIGRKVRADRDRKVHFPWVALGIAIDLLILVFYKYVTTIGFPAVQGMGLTPQVLKVLGNLQFPVGLSFISFQVIAYLLDIQRDMSDGEEDFFIFAWYILLFPKILSGPITRYRDLRQELKNPQVNLDNITLGIRRFIRGLARKVLIADTLARLVTPVFAMASPNVSPAVAWLVLISFAVQIYFDFSGIIDMAIGMGNMLGFHFMENFNYPYISRSITEFWRRWHISLSSWFRDYIFYPLEFNRSIHLGQAVDIMIIFLLTGLWHGFTLPFILWGMVNGLAVAFETTRLGKFVGKGWRPLQHIYALAVMLVAWVFFRSPTLAFALDFFRRLAGDASGLTPLSLDAVRPLPIIEPSICIALGVGLFLSVPLMPFLQKQLENWIVEHERLAFSWRLLMDVSLILLLIFSIAMIASGSFAPGLYGRF
jgi:alginate O-acetyltransferase complex protein AlgI